MHRMGTIYLAESNFERATNFLSDAEQHFQKHLGPKDPLTGEAQLCLAIARVKVMDSGHGIQDPFSRVLAPVRRESLLSQAKAGLAAMHAGFGEDHMLVKKGNELHELLTPTLETT